MKKKFNKDAWKQDKDWQRVLTAWRSKYGNTALTLNALATICDRPWQDILHEMRGSNPQPACFICEDISAPVFMWQRRRSFEWNNGDIKYLNSWYFDNGEYREPIARLASFLCKEYPPPKYCGLEGFEGITYNRYKYLIPYALGTRNPVGNLGND